MLVADKFIYIHQPKTGGTFVHDVLFQVFDIKWKWYHGLLFFVNKEVEYQTKYGKVVVRGAKHDACNEVEKKWLEGRVFLSNIRNPLDQYVSQYEFGWWKRKEFLKYYQDVEGFRSRFPGFPDLSFVEFMELEYSAYSEIDNKDLNSDGLGLQSQRFLKYYAKRPKESIPALAKGWQSKEEIESHLFNISFLKTQSLNHDLYNYLKDLGFDEASIAFIHEKKKVLPLGIGRTKDQKWQKYYTPELLETVLRKDKLLFDLFPEFIPKTL